MKRVSLLVLAVLCAAALYAAAALAAPPPRTEPLPGERSVNLVLAGSPGNDRITIELSLDGTAYEVDSATPLEVGGGVCPHPDKRPEDLLCEASLIAGFEINVGGGDDVVTLGHN